jgi:hypothetical protein
MDNMGKLFPAFLLKKRDGFYLATAGFRPRLLADTQLLLLHLRQICNGSCTRKCSSARNLNLHRDKYLAPR